MLPQSTKPKQKSDPPTAAISPISTVIESETQIASTDIGNTQDKGFNQEDNQEQYEHH